MFKLITHNGSTPTCFRRFYSYGLLLFGLASGLAVNLISAQDVASPTMPEKVTLKWKFHPDQTFRGKLTFQIHTMTEPPKRSWFVFDYTWKVKSVDRDGVADIVLHVNRGRASHRSEKVNTDYDSDQASSFHPTAEEASEIEPLLKTVRDFTQQDYQFRLSPFGIEDIEKGFKPVRLINWPELPLQPVAVGDTWTRELRNGEVERYTLAKLERVKGELFASIIRHRDQLSSRFNVDQGRFIENVTWTINKYLADQPNAYFQHYSGRCRLELANSVDEYSDLPLLQPIQPGRGMHMIAKSIRHGDQINEIIVGEKDMLYRLQLGLYVEHAEKMDFPEGRADWAPLDWMLYSRYLERTGDLERRSQILVSAAEAVAQIPEKTDILRNFFLLQFSELLARAGLDDEAEKACRQIHPEAFAGMNVTGEGVYSVSESALADYALLELARNQATAGRFVRSLQTAAAIKANPARSAAYWTIAIQMADQGMVEMALKASAQAQELYSEQAKLFEFLSDGIVETKLSNFRTLALGRIALCQARQGAEQAAKQTLDQITSKYGRTAAEISLLFELEKSNAGSLAEAYLNDLPPESRDRGLAYRIEGQLSAARFADAAKLLDKLNDPIQQVASLLRYCHSIQAIPERASELQTRLEQAESAIPKIAISWKKAEALRDYARLLRELGKKEQARTALNAALEAATKGSLHGIERISRQLEIAEALAPLSQGSELDDLLASIEKDTNNLREPERSQQRLSIVRVFVERHAFDKAEAVAAQIADVPLRCQALTLIGKRLAYLLELESSRAVFRKAFASAQKVEGIAALNSNQMLDGAIRFVAYQQGECDLEGLITYLEAAEDANILAYGYLGGAEAFDPEAAKHAGRFGRVSNSTLTALCKSNLACQLIALKLPLPVDLPWLNLPPEKE